MFKEPLDLQTVDEYSSIDASRTVGNQDALNGYAKNGASISSGESHEQEGAVLSDLMTHLQIKYDLRTRTTLFLVGEDSTTLSQLARTLEEKHSVEVMNQPTVGLNAISQIAELQPDVVLLDIGLSVTYHRRTIQLIRAASPATRILILALDSVPGHILHAYWCGVHGYVLKDSESHEIVDAIYAIRSGSHYLDKSIQLPNRQTTQALENGENL
ncbi:MAG: response regulator [Chloroflexota bacterium]